MGWTVPLVVSHPRPERWGAIVSHHGVQSVRKERLVFCGDSSRTPAYCGGMWTVGWTVPLVVSHPRPERGGAIVSHHMGMQSVTLWGAVSHPLVVVTMDSGYLRVRLVVCWRWSTTWYSVLGVREFESWHRRFILLSFCVCIRYFFLEVWVLVLGSLVLVEVGPPSFK